MLTPEPSLVVAIWKIGLKGGLGFTPTMHLFSLVPTHTVSSMVRSSDVEAKTVGGRKAIEGLIRRQQWSSADME